MRKRSPFTLVIHLVILAVLLLSHGYAALQFVGGLFAIELVLLLLFLLLTFVSLFSFNRTILSAFYLLALINSIVIYTQSNNFPYLAFLSPLIGYALLLATPHSRKVSRKSHSFSYKGPKSVVYDSQPEVQEKTQTKKAKVSKDFSPGKFLASKTSAVYHAPKCEWAKKIKKDRRVWFTDHKAAKKEGYSKHSCLK